MKAKMSLSALLVLFIAACTVDLVSENESLEHCWSDLANENPLIAYEAMWSFVITRETGSRYLRERILPRFDEAYLRRALDEYRADDRKLRTEALDKILRCAPESFRVLENELSSAANKTALEQLQVLIKTIRQPELIARTSRQRKLAYNALKWNGTDSAMETLERVRMQTSTRDEREFLQSLLLEEEHEPTRKSAQGIRAFEDLAKFYRDATIMPKFQEAIDQLASPDDKIRRAAMEYLTCLVAQSIRDANTLRLGCGSVDAFEDFRLEPSCSMRSRILKELGNRAQFHEPAIELLLRVIADDPVPANQIEAVNILCKIQTKSSAEIIERILSEPNANPEVLSRLIDESTKRKLPSRYRTDRFLVHHRKLVRETAQRNLPADFMNPRPEHSLSADQDLTRLINCIVEFQMDDSHISLDDNLLSVVSAAKMWISGRDDRYLKIVTDAIEQASDDRTFLIQLREAFGHAYHRQLLNAFCLDRDYQKALLIAKHLSKGNFQGFSYWQRAKNLSQQLSERKDDFRSFRLPTVDEWEELKKHLNRNESLRYLAIRLRLLNCIQRGSPDEPELSEDQYETPWTKRGMNKSGVILINPLVELRRMPLTKGDAIVLSQFLSDESFMPTFSYWRDFHPSRDLFRVNKIVGQLINSVVGRRVFDHYVYYSLSESGRRNYIRFAVDSIP